MVRSEVTDLAWGIKLKNVSQHLLMVTAATSIIHFFVSVNILSI